MAFANIPGWPLPFPGGIDLQVSFAAYADSLIDAATEKVAFIIQCPQDGVLNRVGFRFGTVTQAPANGLTVSFQTVGADGNPDGTQDQTRLVASGSIVSNSWVTTGLITSDGTDTGTKRTVTQGEPLAIVIEYASFLAGDSLNVTTGYTGVFAANNTTAFPYTALFTAAWVRSLRQLNLGLQYDDGSWVPIWGALPSESLINTLFTSASNPDELGMQFVCPFAMRVVGFSGTFRAAATTSTYRMSLYDSSNTLLAATIMDPDIAGATNQHLWSVYFNDTADSVELTKGATYRVTAAATGAGSIVASGYIPDSTDFMSAMPWGADGVAISRQNLTGDFTAATDGRQYALGLLVNGVQAGAPRARYILGAL